MHMSTSGTPIVRNSKTTWCSLLGEDRCVNANSFLFFGVIRVAFWKRVWGNGDDFWGGRVAEDGCSSNEKRNS